jgi:hypothetical protein
MGRPAITSFIVREVHSVLKLGLDGGVLQFKPLIALRTYDWPVIKKGRGQTHLISIKGRNSPIVLYW